MVCYSSKLRRTTRTTKPSTRKAQADATEGVAQKSVLPTIFAFVINLCIIIQQEAGKHGWSIG